MTSGRIFRTLTLAVQVPFTPILLAYDLARLWTIPTLVISEPLSAPRNGPLDRRGDVTTGRTIARLLPASAWRVCGPQGIIKAEDPL